MTYGTASSFLSDGEACHPPSRRSGLAFAHAITILTNPTLLSTVFFAALARKFAPPGNAILIGAIAVGFAGLLPSLIVLTLRKLRFVKDLALTVKSERPVVYRLCALAYALGTIALVAAGAPWQIPAAMALQVPLMLSLLVLTRDRKVSIHTSGITALLGMSLFVMWPAGLLFGAALPLAAWARWTLRAHTWPELWIGAAVGAASGGGGLLLLSALVGK